MIWEEYQIEIDRQSRYIAYEAIYRLAALECEGVFHKDERYDSRKQSGSVEIGLLHGLSTSIVERSAFAGRAGPNEIDPLPQDHPMNGEDRASASELM